MHLTGLPVETVTWIAAFAAIFVTVLYLVKLRRRRIEVPFTPLWERVSEQSKNQTDWRRRLRRLISWLIHIAVAGLLVGAMLGIQTGDEPAGDRHVLVLVDDSASMHATDVTGAGDRFDYAVDRTAELLGELGDGDRVLVATFNDRVQPLGSFGDDPADLEQRLRDRRPTAHAADVQRALDFAADALEGRPGAEVVVVTDGADLPEDPLTTNLDADATVHHLEVGTSSDNLAVTGLQARRYPANRLDHEVFVEVRSFFDRPVDATLELWADDQLVETRPLTLEARQTHRAFFSDVAAAGERIEARVRLETGDARDVFGLDDRARATIPPPRRLAVTLVTEQNLFLEGPLLVAPHIDLEVLDPADWEADAARDVTIFDGVAPSPPARGDVLYFGPPAGDSPFEIAQVDDEPLVTDVRDNHPLMQWVTLTDLNIEEATLFETTVDDTGVADVFGQPVIVARQTDDRRMVAVGFDLHDSDFPLRVGFPVFLLNVMDYFADQDETLRSSYDVGETWQLPVEPGVESAEIVEPTGQRHTATIRDGRLTWYGDRPGFYRLETPEEDRYFAANLADPSLSDVQPTPIELEDREVSDRPDLAGPTGRPLWIGLLVAAFALLFVEWVTYNRRWTV